MTTPKKATEKKTDTTHQAPQDEPTTKEHAPELEPATEETAPEPSEEVRNFARTVRGHSHTRNKVFEPARGISLQYGYNGLLRTHAGGGFHHVHVATHDELAEMSDQALYDAVMQAKVGRR